MVTPNIEKLVQSFDSKDIVEAGDWFARVLERFDRPGAFEFFDAIQQRWKTRKFSLPPGEDRERPDPGLLKALGYRVGWYGQNEVTRALIIADHLPPIKDQKYMAEWGGPKSLKRYMKFDRVLHHLIDEHRETKPLAVAEWQVDREVARRIWNEINADRAELVPKLKQ